MLVTTVLPFIEKTDSLNIFLKSRIKNAVLNVFIVFTVSVEFSNTRKTILHQLLPTSSRKERGRALHVVIYFEYVIVWWRVNFEVQPCK